MSTGFAFPTTQSSFGTSGGNFNFAGGSGTSGLGGTGMFGTSTGLSSSNPTNTSGGLTLGSAGAGTLFSSASFPSATTTPSLFSGFGNTATSKPTLGFGLTGSIVSTAPSSTGFGWSATSLPSTSTPAFSFNVGSNLGASTGGLGAAPFSSLGSVVSQPLSLGLGVQSTPSVVGLGGVDFGQSSGGDAGIGNISGKKDNKAVKEIPVPNEILQTVEGVKKYIKEQKNIREEITRISSKPLFKVQEETDVLKHLLSVVSSGIQRNVSVVEKLKLDATLELKYAEIAQRTKDTPPGLQYENNAPTEYFQNMLVIFENRMQLYRQKIEQMERHLLALSQSAVLTPQELTLAMRRIHETFIALAAQLQIIHEAVKMQKEQYLNYRKVFHGDLTNIFESKSPTISEVISTKNILNRGPTPFSGLTNVTAAAMASAANRMQQPTAGPPPTLGFNSSNLGCRSGLFSSSNIGLGSSFGSSVGGLSSSGLGFGSSNTSAIKPLGK